MNFSSISLVVEQATKKVQDEGFQLSEIDIRRAWEVLSPAGRDEVSKQELADTLKLFFPDLTFKRVKELAGPGPMTQEKLLHMLNTPVKGFDPAAEAFKVLDPKGTGYVDEAVLRRLFLSLPGIDEVSDEDLTCMMELADSDKDGRISLQDFNKLGQYGQQKPEADTARAKSITFKSFG